MSRRRRSLLTLGTLFLGGMLLLSPTSIRAEDVVTIRSGRTGQESTRRLFGTITNIRGERLIMLRGGREEGVDLDKVVRYETTYQPQHLEAQRQFQAGNDQAALRLFRDAVEREDRNWVRREILAEIVACQRNLGQIEQACETFLIVYESDPETRRLDAIPLAWRTVRPSATLQAKAATWLRRDDNSAAQLLGASWLLAGGQRGQALTVLRDLTDDDDVRLAQLAQAQLWRSELVTANESHAKIWAAAIERMGPEFRGGPYYMLGRLHARLKQPRLAALALLRAPVLFPHDRPLAQQSLLAAAGELETLGQIDAAQDLYRELLRDYAGSLLEDETRARLRQLEEKRKKPASN